MLKTFLVLSCVLLLGICFNLSAEGNWTRPRTLSCQNASNPNIGVDSSGNAVAIWREFSGKKTKIQTARFTNGKWSKPVKIATIKINCYVSPQIAVNDSGNAVAVWEECVDESILVKAATMSPKGKWSAPVTLSNLTSKFMQTNNAVADDGATAGFADPTVGVAINSSGFAVAVWANQGNCKDSLQASTLQTGGNWSQPVTILAEENMYLGPLKVALDSLNNIAVAWQKFDPREFNFFVQVATRFYSGIWSQPVTLSAGGAPQIAFDPFGNVTALWDKLDGTYSSVYTSTFSYGGNWSDPVVISVPGTSAMLGCLAYDKEGNALAAWELDDSTCTCDEKIYIQATYCPAGGIWSAPTIISNSDEISTEPRIVFDSLGNAIVAWDDERVHEENNELIHETVIQAAIRSPDGSWTPPATLSAENQDSVSPKLAINSDGVAAIVWTNKTFTVVQAATCNSINELLKND